MMQLSVEVVGDLGVIGVRGELDHLQAPELQGAVQRALHEGARSLAIDCAEVTFIDSTGVSALIDAHERTSLRFGTVTVRNAGTFLLRVFEMAELDRVLLFESSPTPVG
jgi:anti-anti-sigma factor